MKKIRIILCFLLTTVMVSSCSPVRQVSFLRVDDIDFVPWTGLTVAVSVDNGSRKDMQLTGLDVVAYYEDNRLGTVSLKEPVIIKRNSLQTLELPMKIKMDNIFSAAEILNNLEEGLSNVKLDITGTVYVNGISRTMKRKNIALSDFMYIFE